MVRICASRRSKTVNITRSFPITGPIKLGTLKSILRSVAQHHGMSVAELMEMLDL